MYKVDFQGNIYKFRRKEDAFDYFKDTIDNTLSNDERIRAINVILDMEIMPENSSARDYEGCLVFPQEDYDLYLNDFSLDHQYIEPEVGL